MKRIIVKYSEAAARLSALQEFCKGTPCQGRFYGRRQELLSPSK